MSLDLLADGLERSMGAQETIGQGLVFAQESEKKVLRLDIGRPELAGFVASEKDNAPGFLRIAFKHNAFPLTFRRENLARPTDRTQSCSYSPLFYRHYAIKGPQNQSTETILQPFDHVTEGTVARPSRSTSSTKFMHFVLLILLPESAP